VSASNPMVGLEGRASLLLNLSRALEQNPTFFGAIWHQTISSQSQFQMVQVVVCPSLHSGMF